MNGPRHRISLTSSMQSFNSIWIPALQMRTTSVTSISPVKQMVFRKIEGGGTAYSAILHTAERSAHGWKSVATKLKKKIQSWLCSYRQGRTRSIFTIISTTAQKYALSEGRLKFGNSNQGAPFPSMVVIFRGPQM